MTESNMERGLRGAYRETPCGVNPRAYGSGPREVDTEQYITSSRAASDISLPIAIVFSGVHRLRG